MVCDKRMTMMCV